MPRRRLFNIVAAVVYVAWIAAIFALASSARSAVIDSLSTPEAQAEWDQWREAAKSLNDNGPVKRRVPKGSEPPALVLMRDYFGVVRTAGVVFGTLIFGAVAWPLRGVVAPREPSPSA